MPDNIKLPVFNNSNSLPVIPNKDVNTSDKLPVFTTNETLEGGRFANVGKNLQAYLPIDSYRKYITNPRLDTNLDALRAGNQSSLEQWRNFGAQFLGEIVGGAVSGIGAIPEFFDSTLPQVYNTVVGNKKIADADFNNWMMQMGEDIMSYSKQIAPIYAKNPSKTFNTGELAWWLNNGVSIASTLSMMIPGFAVTKGLSMFGKAGQAISKTLQADSKIGKVLNATEYMTKRQKELTKMYAMAGTMRNAENMRESFQVTNQVKETALNTFQDDSVFQEALLSDIGQQYLAEGKAPTKDGLANYIAAKAGHRAYAINSVNIVFDLIQSAALLNTSYFTRTGKGFSKGVEKAVRGGTELTKAQSVFQAGRLYGTGLLEQLSEGVEEGINFIGTAQATKEAVDDLNAYNKDDVGGIFDNLKEYIYDPNMHEAAFWGVAGGVAFKGATELIKASRPNDGRQADSIKIGEIQNRYANIKAFNSQVATILKSDKTGTKDREVLQTQLKAAKDKLSYNLALNAAKAGNVDLLLDTIENGQFQEMVYANLTKEDIAGIGAENLQKEIEDTKNNILKVERYYNDAINKFSNRGIQDLTKQAVVDEYIGYKYNEDVANTQVAKFDLILNGHVNSNPKYDELIKQGRNVDAALRLRTLNSMLNDAAYAPYKQLIETEIKEVEIFFADDAAKKISGFDEQVIIDSLEEREFNRLVGKNSRQAASDLLKDSNLKKIDKIVEKGIEKKKEIHAEKEYLTYTKSVIDSLQGKSIEEKIAILTKEKTVQTGDKHKRFLGRELGHLRTLQSKQKNQTPLSTYEEKKPGTDNATRQPAKNLEEQTNQDFQALVAEFSGNEQEATETIEGIVAIISNENKTPTVKRKELEKKLITVDIATQPALTKVYTNAIENLKKDEVLNTRNKEGDVVVGDKYNIKGLEVTVKRIYDDGAGRTMVAMDVVKDGKTLLSVKPIEYLKGKTKIGVIVGEKGRESIQDITDKKSITTTNQFVDSVIGIDNFPYPDILEYGQDIEIEFVNKLPNNEVFNYSPSQSKLYVSSVGLQNLIDNSPEKFAKAFAHEIIHHILYKGNIKTLRNRLRTIIPTVVIPDSFRGTVAQDRIELIKQAKYPEELLAYFLTEPEVYNLLNDGVNKNAFIAISELLHSNPEYTPLVTLLQKQNEESGRVFRLPENIVTEQVELVAYTATPGAEELIQYYDLNANQIQGTGKDGKIVVGDVRKFIKENKVKSYNEIRDTYDVTSDPVPHNNEVNIYIPFINLGIKNGVVSADEYNKKTKGAKLTQAELEKTVREILSPSLNKGSRLLLRYTVEGGIGIYSNDNTLIGFINDPSVTTKTVTFLEKVLDSSVEELNGLLEGNITKGEESHVRWRLRELTEEDNKDKPLVNELSRIKDSEQNERLIHEQFAASSIANPDTPVFIQVTRKTSGNFAHQQDEDADGNIIRDTMPLKDMFPDIDTLWFRNPSEAYPNLYSFKDGTKFSRNEDATEFYNHDLNYNQGQPYILIPGANSFGDRIDTMIPIPVYMQTATKEIAEDTATYIAEYIKRAKELIAAGEIENLYNNPDLIEIKKKIEAYYAVEGRKEFNNYFHFDKTGIRYNFIDNGTEMHAHIVFNQKPSGQTVLYLSKTKDRPNRYTEGNSFSVATPKGDRGQQLSLTGNPQDAKHFRTFIIGTLQNKQVNIDFNKKGDAIFKDDKTYLEWMLDSGVVHTDLSPLQNDKGQIMRDERGNALPNVTGKYDNKRNNSNLIISVASTIETPFNLATKAVRDKNTRLQVDNITSVISAINKQTLNHGINLQELFEIGSTSATGIENANSLSAIIQKNLPTGFVVDFINNRFIIKEDYSELPQTTKKEVKPGEQQSLFKIVQEGDETKEVIDIEATKKWWSEVFGDNIEMDTNIVGMMNRGGKLAWGVFENAMVRLSKSAPIGTEYHEAYHVVHNLYLSEDERTMMLDEERNRSGNLGIVELEEILADRFMDYMLKNGNTNRITEQEKNIFKRLWNLIKEFFNKYSPNQSKTDQVFRNIKEGKYNYAPSDSVKAAAKNISRTRLVEGLTAQQEQEATKIIAKKIIELYENSNGNVTERFGDPKDRVRESLLRERNTLSENFLDNLNRVLESETYNKLWDKSLLYLKRQFELTVNDEIDFDAITEVEKNWDDTVFSKSQRNSVSNRIKRLIMTTPSKEAGAFLGLEEYLDFNKVYPYIQRNMIGALDISEMMSRLAAMAEFDSTMDNVLRKLEADVDLQKAWFSNFKKQMPTRHVVLFDADSIKIDRSNKTASHYILSNTWGNELETRLEQGYYTPEIKKELAKSIASIGTALDKQDYGRILENTTAIFEHLGIEINSNSLGKILNSNIMRQRFGNSFQVFDNIISPIFNVIDKDIKNYKEGEEARFNTYGNYNRLASIATLFQYDLLENSSLDVNGNNVFSVINPSYLSLFMDRFKALRSDNLTYVELNKAKSELLDLLKEYGTDPATKFSNWLWAWEGNSGMLKLVDGQPDITKITIDSINIDFIDRFDYNLFDGLKNIVSGDRGQYKNMPDNDWLLTQALMFFGGVNPKGNNPENRSVLTSIPIQADSGNIFFLESPKFSGVNKDGTVDVDSILYSSVARMIYQDLYRAIAARDLMFTYNEQTEKYEVREDLDYSILQKNYHYQKLDSNGKPIIIENGVPTGNVFNSFNVRQADGIGYSNGFPIFDRMGQTQQTNTLSEIDSAIDSYIKEQSVIAIELLSPYKAQFNTLEEYKSQYLSFEQFATEFILNFKISTVEQMNFMTGVNSEYSLDKNSKNSILDPNKRVKQITSPGVSLASLLKESFTGATISDINLVSEYFDNIAKSVADTIKKDYKEKTIDVKNLRSKDTAKMNSLEKAVFKIVGSYLNTNIGDGQGYISVDRYEQILQGLGRLTPQYKSVIAKIKRGIALDITELELTLQPIKGFYYERKYDPTLGRMVSSQIKYSTVPLISRLVLGTQLENLSRWMNENNLDEVFFESAEKVGTKTPIKITDNKGNIDLLKLEQYSTKNGHSFREYANAGWRLQVDNPDHLIDDENKLGTQIAKIIIGNLAPNTVYEYSGKKAKAKELIQDYMDTMTQNIQEDAQALLDDMGIVKDGERYIVTDIEKIRGVLMSEAERRDIGDNYIDALDLVEDVNGIKEFKLPLFANIMANKWESILSSLFTNNITNQKFPGGSLVRFSSAFITSTAEQPNVVSAEGLTLLQSNDTRNGIDWIQSKRDNKNFTLAPSFINKSGVLETEALLPYWSKKFFIESNETISIDQIAKEAPELLEQIWYRIPYEKKGNSVVIKVVGFLPKDQGNILVLPQEAITMSGEDFDFDKRYGMYREFYRNDTGNIVTYKWYENANDDAFNQWLVSRRGKQFEKELIANPTEAIKRVRTQAKRFDSSKKAIKEIGKEIYEEQEFNIHNINVNIKEALGIQDYDTNIKETKQILINSIKYLEDNLNDTNRIIASRYWEEGVFNQLVEHQSEVITQLQNLREINRELNFVFNTYSNRFNEYKETKERKEELADKYSALYYDETISELRDRFNRMPIYERNPREARNNRLLDIMSAVLTNKAHYAELMSPSGFSQSKEAIDEIHSIPGFTEKQFNSFSDFATQNFLRQRNIDGRALKGMAADANSFMTVMQVSKMELRPDLAIIAKYGATEYSVDELKKKYGDNNVKEVGKFIYVRHHRFGWNADNSFTDVNNNLITENVSELLSLSLDIVKEGMIPGLNTYTFFMFNAMLGTGVSIRNAAMFVNQPFVKSLNDYYFSKQSVIETVDGNEISKIKAEYASKLIAVRNKLGRYSKVDSKKLNDMIFMANNGWPVNVKEQEIDLVLGYKIPDHLDMNNPIAFSESEMKAMIEYYGTEFDTAYKGKDQKELIKAEKFLINQMLIAEKFLKYKEAGEGYSDILNAMSTDRRSVGPSISKTIGLNDAIHHATYYESVVRAGNIIPKNGTVIKGVPSFRDIHGVDIKESGKINKKQYVVVSEGARILVKNDKGDKIPATEAVYGENSVYPVLKSYKEFANNLGYQVISEMLLKYTPAFKEFVDNVRSSLGLRHNDDLYNKAATFAQVALVGELDFFNNSDREVILGVNKPKILLTKEIKNFEDFQGLSVANKLAYVKQRNRNNLINESHILNYLNPKLSKREVRRTGFHSIEFINSMTDSTIENNLINSFMDLWNSRSIYERDLARDLVRYSYFTNGFTHRANSFSKLIPVDILASPEIGYVEHFKRIERLAQDSDFLIKYKFGDGTDMTQRFIMSQYDNSSVVPKLNLFNSKIAEQWQVDDNLGVLSIDTELHKFQNPKIIRSTYLSVPIIRTKDEKRIKVAEHLYAFVKSENGRYYYVRVNKLGNKHILETTGTSIIPGNNSKISLEQYERIIDGSAIKPNVNGKEYRAASDSPALYKLLWGYATGYIGSLSSNWKAKQDISATAVIDFGEAANMTEYSKEDLIMVGAPTMYATNSVDNLNNKIHDFILEKGSNGVRLAGEYSKIYTALANQATIAMPSFYDEHNNRVKDMNSSYHVGLAYIQQHLNKLVDLEKLDKIVSNGIIYYATPGNLKTVDNHKC